MLDKKTIRTDRDRLLLQLASLVEAEHVEIKYCQILALKLILLRGEQIVLASHQLHDVLQTQTKLLTQQFVAVFSTLC